MTATVIAEFLEEKHKAKIQETVAKYGFDTAFFQNPREAADYLQDTEILFTKDPSLITHAPNVRWICTPNAGVESFLEPGVLPEDILFTNSSGAYGLTISEHVVMVILELLRRQPEYAGLVSEKKWVRHLPIRSIRGSRITMIGTGDIGTEAARKLRAFGPDRIVGVNRSGRCPDQVYDRVDRKENLNQLLSQTDILVMSLPGGQETWHYLDREMIASLPCSAIVVNVGRGTTIDQEALAAALDEEKIAGAALDVFETEPIPADDPLWDCKNLLLTPHIAGNMTLGYTVDRCVNMFCEDIDNYCSGRPLSYPADRELGY